MFSSSKIFVAGRGLVGSALLRALQRMGYANILSPTRQELDLTSQADVKDFFEEACPEYVFLAAAKVGGIEANNTRRAEFIYENLIIEANVIHQAHLSGVKRFLFLGSSCIYPRDAEQPMREESLLTGPLEQTNEPYAVAKMAGLKMCESYRRQHGDDFFSVMPTNLYGPGDNYDLNSSHVLPALLRKAHEAKVANAPYLEVWGSGRPLREFLHVDDLADACVFLMNDHRSHELLNVGSGEEVSIRKLAEIICSAVGYDGELRFDPSRPDGAPRKLLDTRRLADLGWTHKIDLTEGIAATYVDFLMRLEEGTLR